MSGLFVTVEGPDGVGKTTLARGLARRLRQATGRDVLMVREPGGTPVAEAARRAFLDPALDAAPLAELFLLLAARADLVAKVIRPALADGRVVLCDRFDLSTEAYQIAGRGLDAEAVRAANRLATGGLGPDVVLVLDAPAEVRAARQRADGRVPDRLEQADREFHERVAESFRRASGARIVHLDATLPPETVEATGWRAVEACLAKQTVGHRVE